jgi:hypothetical protein
LSVDENNKQISPEQLEAEIKVIQEQFRVQDKRLCDLCNKMNQQIIDLCSTVIKPAIRARDVYQTINYNTSKIFPPIPSTCL